MTTSQSIASSQNAPATAAQSKDKQPPLAITPPEPTATATVTVNGQAQKLELDDMGIYPVVKIEAQKPVPVSLSYANGKADDPVLVRVEDGGRLDAAAAGKLLKLDAEKTANFEFASNMDMGIYRVVVTKGSETNVLQFWVGPEMPRARRTVTTSSTSN